MAELGLGGKEFSFHLKFLYLYSSNLGKKKLCYSFSKPLCLVTFVCLKPRLEMGSLFICSLGSSSCLSQGKFWPSDLWVVPSIPLTLIVIRVFFHSVRQD